MSTFSLPSSASIPGGRPQPVQDWVMRLFGAAEAAPEVKRMERHDAVFARARAGSQVACLQGCVWVTIDGEPTDTVLEAGDTFTAQHAGRVGVYALERSEVRWF